MDISVNFSSCFIYVSFPQNLLSLDHVHSIFLTNGLFMHKLHNQIGSRINCCKWSFLILTLMVANEDGWNKTGMALSRGGLSFPTVVAKGKFVCKGKNRII